jgi:hypothetical protein
VKTSNLTFLNLVPNLAAFFSIHRRRRATVDLALLKTSEMIQGAVAVLPPPGFKPRGKNIPAIWREGKFYLVFEVGHSIPREGHFNARVYWNFLLH